VQLDAVVGMGSNLGDRLRILELATRRLASAAGPVSPSSGYQGPALGPPQPDYLNAAARISWSGTPRALLGFLLDTEKTFGRQRRERWGPRTLDLDILWIDAVAIDEPDLHVPHRDLGNRAFALIPLLEVAPAARDPRTGVPLADWSRQVNSDHLVKVAPPWRVP
jgi:2-amino-4-hydroxy-6-hydroxymethyldihydropteridine diphosphokinase